MTVSKSITVVLIMFMLAPLHAENAKPPCDEFKRLIDLPRGKGLDRNFLTMSSIKGGEEEYFNLDVDGDDVSDVIKGGCSSSLMPADPCFLSVEMSSGKKIKFTFDITEQFFLIRHKSMVYAIASPTLVIKDKKERLSFEQTRGRRSALRLDGRGITRICTQL
ncbi:MAG: hypothetical protein AB7F79_08090 [Steroidobacteraceae bacterium]